MVAAPFMSDSSFGCFSGRKAGRIGAFQAKGAAGVRTPRLNCA